MLVLQFIRALKNKEPKLFYFFLLCVLLQVIVTAIKLEVTPFLLYGMYSQKFRQDTLYQQQQIFLDGKNLEAFSFSGPERMMLYTTAENYLLQKENKGVDPLQTRIESRYPFFTNTPFYPWLSARIYNKPEAMLQYEQWLKKRLSRKLNREIKQISITRRQWLLPAQSYQLQLLQHDTLARF